MMDIPSENSEKEYPKSVYRALKTERKKVVQGASYFINKIPIFI
jgi:hypothetical protein